MIIAVPKEIMTDERRVAATPETVAKYIKLGFTVKVEAGAGRGAFHSDEAYAKAGATIETDVGRLWGEADLVLKVKEPIFNGALQQDEADLIRSGATLITFLHPATPSNHAMVEKLRSRNITALTMDGIPRISRAQRMDALTSMSTLTGYKAVLTAAAHLPVVLPMVGTAIGAIKPAMVLVVGAGVVGLQAIATAKRLGAMVEAYDIRPAARQEIESLGAKMIDTGVSAEGEGGYARELTAEEKQKQADALARHIAAANAVITTAAIPGRPAPKIVTTAMVEAMKRGAVIVDLAAESGGNCELTQPGETIEHNGVVIAGPLNIPSSFPVPASEMYAKNLYNFLSPMIKDGALNLDWNDEVIAKSALTRDGQVCHEPTRKLLEQ